MARLAEDGDLNFGLGMDSVSDPERLAVGAYARGYNIVKRGGALQCRPGFSWRLNLPTGKLQGAYMFRPSEGGEQIVFAVDGNVYVSEQPYRTYRRLRGVKFLKTSPRVYFCAAERAVQRNPDLSLTLIRPRSVLMMQDGRTAPAFYDGSDDGHVAGGINKFHTPVGTAMCWSGGRLWVGHDQRVLASDIADPFSFFEGQYLGDLGAFVLPGRVTALAEIPSVDSPALLAFTGTSTTMFQSNIRVRSEWLNTANFQLTILPNIGCVASKSPVVHNGLLWWFSQYGLTNLNFAMASQQTGQMAFADLQMAVSKGTLSSDLAGVSTASFENYLLCSVPHADKFNRHTWVMDTAQSAAWDGYWTGVRPVEWICGEFNGSPRIFCVSADHDGGNRLWEAFSAQRTDDCCPITWGFDTRAFAWGSPAQVKRFRYADIYLSELTGDVDVTVAWAGANKGRFNKVLTKRIRVAKGALSAETTVRLDHDDLFGFKPQSRWVRTGEQELSPADPLGAAQVESDFQDWIDTSFQLNVTLNGPGAVRGVRVFAHEEAGHSEARCEKDETKVAATRFDGAGARKDTLDQLRTALAGTIVTYTATKNASHTYRGVTTQASATASSTMSQAVADKMAQAAAECKAAFALRDAVSYTGGSLSTVEACPSTTGRGALNYSGFQFWTVEDGFVDLRGNGFDDALPCHGMYVDLISGYQPSGENPNGALTSRETFDIVSGNVYRVTLRLAGNQLTEKTGDPTDTVRVRLFKYLDNTVLWEDTVLVPDFDAPLFTYKGEFTAPDDGLAKLSIQQIESVGGNDGVLLKEVIFENLTASEVHIADNFDEENA